MEIDQVHFGRELLPILKHISEAAFISFDLEMSGITTRPKYSTRDRNHENGKPTLQQQYEEMKSAAETFQVLQVGITCVEEDREREYYLARPFNFNLSPLAADGIDLKLDRTFQFSSSACDFLSRNAFDFGKVFRSGVPYLSREEEFALREEYESRNDKMSRIPDVVIPTNEPTALDFYNKSRQEILSWAANLKSDHDYCSISNEAGPQAAPLNGYQRRLIHQLVRNEFPNLRVFSRADGAFMQVGKLNVKREAEFQKKRLRQFRSSVGRQKGLRWVFEALVGGDLSEIEPEWLCSKDSNKSEDQIGVAKLQLEKTLTKLRRKNHVIVGHNLFMDLGFLYKTFKGPLPSKVEDFQEDIHELFPIVIDTKYLATRDADVMNPRSNLKELLEPFKKHSFPLIVLHEKHTAYGSSFGKEHEAGYDSWMTAELFVKLTAQLYAERNKIPGEVDDDFVSEGIEHLNFSDSNDSEGDTSSQGNGGVPLFSPNPFDVLRNRKKQDGPQACYSSLNSSIKIVEVNKASEEPVKIEQFIPPMKNSFWDLYVNKLRVNGTDSGVCDLATVVDED